MTGGSSGFGIVAQAADAQVEAASDGGQPDQRIRGDARAAEAARLAGQRPGVAAEQVEREQASVLVKRRQIADAVGLIVHVEHRFVVVEGDRIGTDAVAGTVTEDLARVLAVDPGDPRHRRQRGRAAAGLRPRDGLLVGGDVPVDPGHPIAGLDERVRRQPAVGRSDLHAAVGAVVEDHPVVQHGEMIAADRDPRQIAVEQIDESQFVAAREKDLLRIVRGCHGRGAGAADD